MFFSSKEKILSFSWFDCCLLVMAIVVVVGYYICDFEKNGGYDGCWSRFDNWIYIWFLDYSEVCVCLSLAKEIEEGLCMFSSLYRYARGGAGPRGALPTLSQYMLSSAATFSFFLSIGSVRIQVVPCISRS